MTSVFYPLDGQTPPSPLEDGVWFAAVHERSILLVEVFGSESEQAERLDLLWKSLSSTKGAQPSLDALTSRGLSATEKFALVRWEDGAVLQNVKVIVRGEIALTIFDDAGESTVDGTGVSTWLEKQYPAARSIRIRAVTSTGDQTSTAQRGSLPFLPMASGVVSTTSLFIESGPRSSEPVATPKSESTPEPSAVLSTPEPVRAEPPAAATASEPAPAELPSPTPVGPPTSTATEQVATSAAPPTDWVDAEATVTVVADQPDDGAASSSPDQAPAGGAESSYDYLFGETVFRTVQDAAVRDEEEADVEPGNDAPIAPVEGDHDGHTVLAEDIAKLRASRQGRPKVDAPATVPAPGPQLYLELPNGTRESLAQPIQVGRAPSVSKVSAGQLPRLLTMSGPDQDISRNHVYIAVEGGTVVVTDLHSRNGTTVTLPGRPAQQLRQGEPTSVIVGTLIDLGGGVTFTVGEEN